MNKKEQYIDAIMDSLDGTQRATPGPFFFTRLQARRQQEQKSPWQTLARIVARPVIAISGLCLILLINTWVVVNHSRSTSLSQNKELSPTDEYTLASNSFYYDENTMK